MPDASDLNNSSFLSSILDSNGLPSLDRKIFTPYLKSVNFFKAYQIFDDYKNILFSSPIIKDSNIYFIVEYDKIKFIPSRVSISRNATINFYFKVGNKKTIKKKINFLTILHQKMPHLSCIFGVGDNYEYQYLLDKKRKEGCKTITGVKIRSDISTDEVIYVDVITETHIITEMPIFLSILLLHEVVSIGNYQKILYVGQSKNMVSRISHHEKIQRATSIVHQDKEIYIHCFKFIDYRLYFNNLDFLQEDNEEILKSGQIDLLEMALINYFKPEYNKKYVNTNISINDKVNTLLKSNNYTALGATVSFDNEFLKYYTDHVPMKNSHVVYYQLKL